MGVLLALILMLPTAALAAPREAAPGFFARASSYPACATLLREIGTDEDDPGEKANYLELTVTAELKPEKGQHGGQRVRLRRNGDNWLSLHGKTIEAPQGDPRWMIKILGEETAAFFGFEMINDNEMWVPLASELNAAIAKINRAGKQPVITAGFYMGSADRSPREEYFGNFINSGAFPLSPDATTLVHDVSFHTAIMFYPRNVMDLAQRQTKIVAEFGDFLAKQDLPRKDRKNAEVAFGFLSAEKASELDAGTGNLTGALARNGSMYHLGSNLTSIMSNGDSPIDYVRKVFPYRNEYVTLPPPNERVMALMEQFLESVKNRPEYTRGVDNCLSPACATILDNIREIRARAALLTLGL